MTLMRRFSKSAFKPYPCSLSLRSFQSPYNEVNFGQNLKCGFNVFSQKQFRFQSSDSSSSEKGSGNTTPAFIFDIDGVLLHDSKPLPGAKNSLLQLYSNKIPFVFLTNNGGKLEVDRLKVVQENLGLVSELNDEDANKRDASHTEQALRLEKERLIMSHTPMADEVKRQSYNQQKHAKLYTQIS